MCVSILFYLVIRSRLIPLIKSKYFSQLSYTHNIYLFISFSFNFISVFELNIL